MAGVRVTSARNVPVSDSEKRLHLILGLLIREADLSVEVFDVVSVSDIIEVLSTTDDSCVLALGKPRIDNERRE